MSATDYRLKVRAEDRFQSDLRHRLFTSQLDLKLVRFHNWLNTIAFGIHLNLPTPNVTLQHRMSEAQNSTTTQATASTSSLSTESITGIVFGICATVASLVTIWQAHRAWRNRHKPLAANPKIASNAFDLSEGSTFATRGSSFATATPPLVTVPGACVTQTNNAVLPRALIAGQVPPIAAEPSPAKSQVSPDTESTASTRLPAIQAALNRLGLPTHEARDPDEVPQSSSRSRESAVKAAIGWLTSSFDVDGSVADPSELVGDYGSQPSAIELRDKGEESSSCVR
ncbi:MAG: hypothetical protein Q9195_002219 [Heterodermia aff. obscurata]